MASVVAVSKAIIERVEPVLPDWDAFWYPRRPGSHPVPALLLMPDETRWGDYQQVVGSYTKWFLRAGLVVDATDEEAAHDRLSELVDPHGPLITRLLDEDLNLDPMDPLGLLCRMDITVTDGRRWKTDTRRKRLSCDICVVCGTA